MKEFELQPNIKFPKINYIGNKEKLTQWIVDNFPTGSGSVLDLFSGGSSVSFECKLRGYKVISNDVLYASFVVAKAIIENQAQTLNYRHIDEALKMSLSVEDKEKYAWLDNKLYFSNELNELIKLIEYSKKLCNYEKYIFQSLIRRAMIRKLPYSRMNVPWASIVKLRDENYSYKKYGRKRAYHNESFSYHMKQNIENYNLSIFNNGKDNIAIQKDALDAIEVIDSVDVIYLDPPYPGTMNNYDKFYGDFDEIFDKKKEHLDLTNKNNFIESLETIIIKAKSKAEYIVLSINSNSIPGISEVSQMLSKYGKIEIKKKKHNYQVSGKVNKNSNNENLLILRIEK
ncbi:DNA adenine methylase [Staphylococcus canis]|uniref:site-specific DNA-methyltransferase (adenine-specific) n=1 Tax=Staphylococcus canis TaxID=2724942 RepID=A0ABS0T8P3_9STAP|nr:DNA adenine methylase [Staphylococcus canis]MBI5974812.1 DNA methyltransferase [Staphylococcus canis]